jgi:hypothetical protein
MTQVIIFLTWLGKRGLGSGVAGPNTADRLYGGMKSF